IHFFEFDSVLQADLFHPCRVERIFTAVRKTNDIDAEFIGDAFDCGSDDRHITNRPDYDFQSPTITCPRLDRGNATESIDARLKSAKARNRGGGTSAGLVTADIAQKWGILILADVVEKVPKCPSGWPTPTILST